MDLQEKQELELLAFQASQQRKLVMAGLAYPGRTKGELAQLKKIIEATHKLLASYDEKPEPMFKELAEQLRMSFDISTQRAAMIIDELAAKAAPAPAPPTQG